MTGEETYNKKKVLKTFLWLKFKEIGILVGGIILIFLHGLFWTKLVFGREYVLWLETFIIGLCMCILIWGVVFIIYQIIKSNWKKAKRIVRAKEKGVN